MSAYIDPLDHLLAGNRHYVQRTTEKDPNTFSDLAKGQAPEILWIGCADSRVPETWLHPVRELRRKHAPELSRLPTDDARAARVAELNVQASLDVLRLHPAIKRAITERGLSLHGMIYDIGAGELKLIGDGGGKKFTGLWRPS